MCPFYRLRVIMSVLLFAGMVSFGLRAWRQVVEAEDPLSNGGVEASVDHDGRAVQLPDELADAAPATVLLDPGHGGSDPGTVAGGDYEKTWTLPVTMALAKELRARGWLVELTRESDRTLPLPERSDMANRKPRLAVVSIHFNSGQPEACGVETYYSWPRKPEVMARLHRIHGLNAEQTLTDDRSRRLAEALQAAVCRGTGLKAREVRNRPDFSITSRSLAPAVLVECAFLTNAREAARVKDPEWRDQLVHSLADGIDAWLKETMAVPGAGIQIE